MHLVSSKGICSREIKEKVIFYKQFLQTVYINKKLKFQEESQIIMHPFFSLITN